MKLQNRHKILIGLFAAAIVISACVFPEKDDPFSRLPSEQTETLEGEIFPFSVSVATRATHRLEKEGKLVAYLASDVVRLDDFVGRNVEVDGVKRTEKMREIFWVESIRLLDVQEVHKEELEDKLFSTKRFAFIYPTTWEYSLSPSGMAHFIQKDDPARRVFLVFSVEELENEDKKTDPNVLISNLAGVKKITTDELDRERQEVVLFSNVYEQKYRFSFTSMFEEFEKKKDFFKLLNSFVEGEDNVRVSEEAYQRRLAELEAEKIKEEVKTIAAQETPETTPEAKEGESFLEKIFGSKSPEGETTEEASSEKDTQAEQASLPKTEKEENLQQPAEIKNDVSQFEPVAQEDYQNLVDEKSFDYESSYYGLRMKVPWGYWFRNFGPAEGILTRIGFSDQEFTDSTGSKFWLEIVQSDTPPTIRSEKSNNTQVVIEFPRSSDSYFRFTGLKKFRDVMRSIEETVKKF